MKWKRRVHDVMEYIITGRITPEPEVLPMKAITGKPPLIQALPAHYFPLRIMGFTVGSTGELFQTLKNNGVGDEKQIVNIIELIRKDPMAFGIGGANTPPPTPTQNGQAQQAAPVCKFTVCWEASSQTFGPEAALKMRLRRDQIDGRIIRNIHQFITDDKVISVCFKPNGEFVTLEDETNLYPSDKLVASFLLLLKS